MNKEYSDKNKMEKQTRKNVERESVGYELLRGFYNETKEKLNIKREVMKGGNE